MGTYILYIFNFKYHKMGGSQSSTGPHPETKVWCDQVYVKQSSKATPDNDFDGAFAIKDIAEGELVEYGVMRILPDNFDGNDSIYVFTWSDEIPNKRWGMGSGCAPFYNTAIDSANTRMERNFEDDSFKIYATRAIKKDEELYHTYKSLKWRKCFSPLNDLLEEIDSSKTNATRSFAAAPRPPTVNSMMWQRMMIEQQLTQKKTFPKMQMMKPLQAAGHKYKALTAIATFGAMVAAAKSAQ